MTNTTGVPLDSFTVGFRGEQWYRNSNANPQLMAFQYGFGNAFGTVPSWTPLGGSFDYFSPVVGSSAASVDGNVAGLVAGRGGTVNVPIASGATLWLRWIERNDSGNDHGLAIDDFSFVGNLAAIPEPTAPLLAALLAATLATTVARRPLQRRVAGVAA